MAVRLSDLRAGYALPRRKTESISGSAIGKTKQIKKKKNTDIIGMELSIFRLVA
jgi:hypothetical protein